MTDAIWIAIITIGGPGAVAGIYRLYNDLRKTREAAIEKAREEALATARLEAVAREAEKALEAKNAENAALRERSDRLEAALIDCAKEVRG